MMNGMLNMLTVHGIFGLYIVCAQPTKVKVADARGTEMHKEKEQQ